MLKMLKKISRFAENRYLQMVVALVLIGSSLTETVGSISEDLTNYRFRVFHGTLLLGVIHFLRVLPEVVEGIERAEKATKSKEL